MSHFEPTAWREFLLGGHVRTVHDGDIPIWAGFLITQIADLQAQIGVILMTQAVSLHQMFQGDMAQVEAAFAQLVAANTAAKQNAEQLLSQIAALQARIAAPDADPVTSTDLDQLNGFAAQIQQAAASTITTTPTAPATSPASSTPVTAPASDTSAATGDTSGAAASSSTTAPAPSTPTTGVGSGAGASSSATSAPVTINAGDSGTGASQ